jgi:hypothetical protein
MRRNISIENAVIIVVLVAGICLYVGAIVLSDAVPREYRSASPGFGWSWDFDYQSATREAGRPGARPWPWPAKKSGRRLLLPLNQPLLAEGVELTYRGRTPSGTFRMDIVIRSLDPRVTYHREFNVVDAKRGLTIADRRFSLENITSRYIRLRLDQPSSRDSF